MKPEQKALLAVSMLSFAACAAAPTEQARATPAPSASVSQLSTSFSDTKWARFRSKRFELSIAFPEGKSWRIDDHGSPWLTARHPATGTLVRARIWHEASIVNGSACERRAREWLKDMPDVSNMEVIDERHIANVPAGGYDTVLRAGIVSTKNTTANAPISSVVLAFGASMKKCFAAVFQSEAAGIGASAQSGDRLAFGTRIIESAVHQSDLEQPGRQPALSDDQR